MTVNGNRQPAIGTRRLTTCLRLPIADCRLPVAVFMCLVGVLSCRATTKRPYFTPLPLAATAQVELGVVEATRALSEALARDSITLRTVHERDGYIDSGWLDAETLEPTRARPLGPGVVRVRAWVTPDREFWSELVVEASFRPIDDPSRPERELDAPLAEQHPLQRRIAGSLRGLVERYGDPESLRALAPPIAVPARPDTAHRDTTAKSDTVRTRPRPDTLPGARATYGPTRAPARHTPRNRPLSAEAHAITRASWSG